GERLGVAKRVRSGNRLHLFASSGVGRLRPGRSFSAALIPLHGYVAKYSLGPHRFCGGIDSMSTLAAAILFALIAASDSSGGIALYREQQFAAAEAEFQRVLVRSP